MTGEFNCSLTYCNKLFVLSMSKRLWGKVLKSFVWFFNFIFMICFMIECFFVMVKELEEESSFCLIDFARGFLTTRVGMMVRMSLKNCDMLGFILSDLVVLCKVLLFDLMIESYIFVYFFCKSSSSVRYTSWLSSIMFFLFVIKMFFGCGLVCMNLCIKVICVNIFCIFVVMLVKLIFLFLSVSTSFIFISGINFIVSIRLLFKCLCMCGIFNLFLLNLFVSILFVLSVFVVLWVKFIFFFMCFRVFFVSYLNRNDGTSYFMSE